MAGLGLAGDERGAARTLARPSAVRLASTALVGRESELGALLRAVASPPALVVVEGEPGVGKTRLVREVLARAELEGRLKLVGHCHPLREPLPFGSVIEALRGAQAVQPMHELGPLAGALRPLIPELAEQLPPALEPLGDPRADRHRVFRAIVEVLRSLGPVICVLEDVHWSDEGTGDLLRFLVAELPDELALVLTYRREDLPASSAVLGLTSHVPSGVACTRLSLAPLDRDEVRELVASIVQVDQVSDEFAQSLHERTQGLPFAVEEVLRLLPEPDGLVQRDGRWARRALDELQLPAPIQDASLERLARLSPDARRVTRAAAVAGVDASEELLQRIAGLSALRAGNGLSEALVSGLMREVGGRFGFRHALALQAVYGGIQTPERRRLHLRAGQELEGGAEPLPLAQIANHYRLADVPRKWLRYAEAAADLAILLGNEPAACSLLVEALRCPEISSPRSARLGAKLGRAAFASLDWTEVVDVLRPVADDDALPVSARGEVRLWLGLLLHDNQAGIASVGAEQIAQAVRELRRRPGLAAVGMSALAFPTAPGHLAEHVAWMDRALETAARARDPALRTAVFVNRASLLMYAGDPAAWDAVDVLPVDIESGSEARQLLRGCVNLAHACTCIGHYARAEWFLAGGRQHLTQAEDPVLAAALDSNSMLLDWARGQWVGLDARARRLSQAMEDVPHEFTEAELITGLLLLARGEILDSKAHLGAARAGGWLPVVVAATGGLARLLLARGAAEEAVEHALSALDLVRSKGIWVWATGIGPVATEALVACGRSAEAARLVAEIAKGVRGRDAPSASAALLVCRGLVAAAEGRGEQAVRAFARAERAWLALPSPYEGARSREARGMVLLTLDGQRETGKELLLGALEGYVALGATWDAARVRSSLRELGVVRPWRGGRRGYGNRLSPREEEVVRLAASGQTNREIAEALVLSRRTVEEHLAKAMRKLGVRSRDALVATKGEKPVDLPGC